MIGSSPNVVEALVPHPIEAVGVGERTWMNAVEESGGSLRDMEMEVLEEGREWMRQRLEQKLQAEANRHGGVFPPERTQGAPPAKKVLKPVHRRRSGKA